MKGRLYEEIQPLKENLSFDKSIIMRDDERNMIFSEIENKMNKKIKQLKILYQATIDGGDHEKFHLKCDSFANTLVLVISKGNRRFGGFTPIPWKSEEKGTYKKDPEMKTFVFSLDNKKIDHLKFSDHAVYHSKNYGPCFGSGHDIGIIGNPFKANNIYTYQNSFDYNGGINSLSECEYLKGGMALEYEVFNVLFF